MIFRNGQFIDGMTSAHYSDMIRALFAARVEILATGRHNAPCVICKSAEHAANGCPDNPLLLAAIAEAAIEGTIYKCFHCRAVFTTDEGARIHFGDDVDAVPRCRTANA